MKLVTYSPGQAQRLAHFDPMAPVHIARAKTAALEAVSATIGQIDAQVEHNKYIKARGIVDPKFADLYKRVMDKSAYHADEIPDYVDVERYETVIGPDGKKFKKKRESIPASEVREKWWKGGSDNIKEEATENMTPGLASKRILEDISTDLGPKGYAAIVKEGMVQDKADRLAIFENRLGEVVNKGNRNGAEQLLLGGLATGLIERADFEVMRLQVSQELDNVAYGQNIVSADDTRLDSLEGQLVTRESLTAFAHNEEGILIFPLTPLKTELTDKQVQSLLGQIDARRSVLEHELKLLQQDTAQEGVERFTNPGGSTLTEGWVNAQLAADPPRLTAAESRALLSMMKDPNLTNDKNAQLVSYWKKELQMAVLDPELGHTSSEAMSLFRNRVITTYGVTGAESADLLAYAATLQNQLDSIPQVEEAFNRIASITGYSPDKIVLRDAARSSTPDPMEKAYTEFRNSLWNYIDETGLQAHPLEFVRSQEHAFNAQHYSGKYNDGVIADFKTRYPEYAGTIEKAGAGFSEATVLNQMYIDYTNERLSPEEFLGMYYSISGHALLLDDIEIIKR